MKYNIKKETLLIRNPEQLFSSIDEEVVMLSVPNGEYYNLNPIGSYIWKILETPVTFDEIVRRLCDEYDVEMQQCIKDTSTFIVGLIEKDVIRIANGR